MSEEISTSIQHPVIVYVALAVAVATMIANAFPKILGPLGNALMDWSRRRREARIAEEDFRIQDLREENDYLKDLRARYVRREYRWSREANRARVWMRKALGLLTDHGIEIEPYPDLMTPDPPSEADNSHKETSDG